MDKIQLGIGSKSLISLHRDDILKASYKKESMFNDVCIYEVWFKESNPQSLRFISFVVDSEAQNDYILNFIESLGDVNESK